MKTNYFFKAIFILCLTANIDKNGIGSIKATVQSVFSSDSSGQLSENDRKNVVLSMKGYFRNAWYKKCLKTN